jgi:hypothetical protein
MSTEQPRELLVRDVLFVLEEGSVGKTCYVAREERVFETHPVEIALFHSVVVGLGWSSEVRIGGRLMFEDERTGHVTPEEALCAAEAFLADEERVRSWTRSLP